MSVRVVKALWDLVRLVEDHLDKLRCKLEDPETERREWAFQLFKTMLEINHPLPGDEHVDVFIENAIVTAARFQEVLDEYETDRTIREGVTRSKEYPEPVKFPE